MLHKLFNRHTHTHTWRFVKKGMSMSPPKKWFDIQRRLHHGVCGNDWGALFYKIYKCKCGAIYRKYDIDDFSVIEEAQ